MEKSQKKYKITTATKSSHKELIKILTREQITQSILKCAREKKNHNLCVKNFIFLYYLKKEDKKNEEN